MKTNFYLSKCILLFAVTLNIFPGISQEPVLNDPVLEKIAGGFNFIEGPLWLKDEGLVFSDIPENKIYIFDVDSVVTVYHSPSGRSNGLALDLQGNLLLCQHLDRQVGRLESNNTITPIATHYNGHRLNSPNDLVVKSDGSVFFTDPPYGLNDQGGTSELGYNGIYRLSPAGNVQLLDNTLTNPNGIAFSPDEKKIYVNDSESRKIYVWDIISDTAIANKELFATMNPTGYADGMKTDKYGFLYVAGPIGIWIFDTAGNAVDTIPVPGQTANCAWGGMDSNHLYVTSGNNLFRIRNKPAVHVSAMNQQKSNAVSSFPNPFTNKINLNFTLEKQSAISLHIYNQTGQLIYTDPSAFFGPGEHSINWNAEDQRPGMYLVVLSSKENQIPSTCIIEKIN